MEQEEKPYNHPGEKQPSLGWGVVGWGGHALISKILGESGYILKVTLIGFYLLSIQHILIEW